MQYQLYPKSTKIDSFLQLIYLCHIPNYKPSITSIWWDLIVYTVMSTDGKVVSSIFLELFCESSLTQCAG